MKSRRPTLLGAINKRRREAGKAATTQMRPVHLYYILLVTRCKRRQWRRTIFAGALFFSWLHAYRTKTRVKRVADDEVFEQQDESLREHLCRRVFAERRSRGIGVDGTASLQDNKTIFREGQVAITSGRTPLMESVTKP